MDDLFDRIMCRSGSGVKEAWTWWRSKRGTLRHMFDGRSLAAAKQLLDELSIEVMDLRTVAPYDAATISASVRKIGRAVHAIRSTLS